MGNGQEDSSKRSRIPLFATTVEAQIVTVEMVGLLAVSSGVCGQEGSRNCTQILLPATAAETLCVAVGMEKLLVTNLAGGHELEDGALLVEVREGFWGGVHCWLG